MIQVDHGKGGSNDSVYKKKINGRGPTHVNGGQIQDVEPSQKRLILRGYLILYFFAFVDLIYVKHLLKCMAVSDNFLFISLLKMLWFLSARRPLQARFLFFIFSDKRKYCDKDIVNPNQNDERWNLVVDEICNNLLSHLI